MVSAIWFDFMQIMILGVVLYRSTNLRDVAMIYGNNSMLTARAPSA